MVQALFAAHTWRTAPQLVGFALTVGATMTAPFPHCTFLGAQAVFT